MILQLVFYQPPPPHRPSNLFNTTISRNLHVSTKNKSSYFGQNYLIKIFISLYFLTIHKENKSCILILHLPEFFDNFLTPYPSSNFFNTAISLKLRVSAKTEKSKIFLFWGKLSNKIFSALVYKQLYYLQQWQTFECRFPRVWRAIYYEILFFTLRMEHFTGLPIIKKYKWWKKKHYIIFLTLQILTTTKSK